MNTMNGMNTKRYSHESLVEIEPGGGGPGVVVSINFSISPYVCVIFVFTTFIAFICVVSC
jgi:hypothetical protein